MANRTKMLEALPRASGERLKAKYLCNCGVIFIAQVRNVTSGRTTSCGCLLKKLVGEYATTKHPLYFTYEGMIARCYRKSHHAYKNYGGRGIAVCSSWLESFSNFVKDMGEKPTPEHTLDRIDNNKDYSPENCKWSTPKEQSSNKRNNVKYTYNGLTLTATDWSLRLGGNRHLVRDRIKNGMDIEKAISTPVRKSKGGTCMSNQVIEK